MIAFIRTDRFVAVIALALFMFWAIPSSEANTTKNNDPKRNETFYKMLKNSKKASGEVYTNDVKKLMKCEVLTKNFKQFPNRGPNFGYSGKCKYEYVTTRCKLNKQSSLTQFSVQAKFTSTGRSEMKYVELEIMGSEYRLYKGKTSIIVDGKEEMFPFTSALDGVRGQLSGSQIKLTTSFGLVLEYNMKDKLTIYLSPSYAKQVCGLCGLGYGSKGEQPFNQVDRENKMIEAGDRKLVTARLADAWRVFDDDPTAPPECQVARTPTGNDDDLATKCHNPAKYEESGWCGRLKMQNAPWTTCLSLMDKRTVQNMYSTCVSQMCGLEGRRMKQSSSYCNMFEQIIDACYEIGLKSRGQKWKLDWREAASCTLLCTNGKLYDIQYKCPATCRNPKGGHECSSVERVDGCFCQGKLVENDEGKCVPVDKCPGRENEEKETEDTEKTNEPNDVKEVNDETEDENEQVAVRAKKIVVKRQTDLNDNKNDKNLAAAIKKKHDDNDDDDNDDDYDDSNEEDLNN